VDGHGSHLTQVFFRLLPRQQDTFVRVTASFNSQLTAAQRSVVVGEQQKDELVDLLSSEVWGFIYMEWSIDKIRDLRCHVIV
jgi:hypothetical protein